MVISDNSLDYNTPSTLEWNGLSMKDKAAFIRLAVAAGYKNIDDIRQLYEELNDVNLFDGGGNKERHRFTPSKAVRDRISKWEGNAMVKDTVDPLSGKLVKRNNSFENEAAAFVNAIPPALRRTVLSNQDLADHLYSYSYNVGAGKFKERVVPKLIDYYNGKATIDDVTNSMWAAGDTKLKGLRLRREVEKEGVRNALLNMINPYTTSSVVELPVDAVRISMPVDTVTPYTAPKVIDTPIFNQPLRQYFKYTPEYLINQVDKIIVPESSINTTVPLTATEILKLLELLKQQLRKTLLDLELEDNLYADGGNLFQDGGDAIDVEGYPLVSSDSVGLTKWFEDNPSVAGMAIGAGLNGIEGERRVVLNPALKDLDARNSVYQNESYRHFFDTNNTPLPPITDAQREAYIGTPYEGLDRRIQETEAARYLSGDPSHNLNEEQQTQLSKFRFTYPGGTLPEVTITGKKKALGGNLFEDGGNIKTILNKVNSSKANFVDRLKDPNRKFIKDWASDGIATHKLSVGTDEYGNHYIYPEVQEINGNLVDFTRPPYDSWAGMVSAEERGDTVRVPSIKEGVTFTENYKKYYPKGNTFEDGGNTDYVADYDDTYGAKYGVLPEVVVTLNNTPNIIKPKLNEEQWQKYWGDEGAASVSRGMNQAAPVVTTGLGLAAAPALLPYISTITTNPIVDAALTTHGVLTAPSNVKEGVEKIKEGNYGEGALDLGLVGLDLTGAGLLSNKGYKFIKNLHKPTNYNNFHLIYDINRSKNFIDGYTSPSTILPDEVLELNIEKGRNKLINWIKSPFYKERIMEEPLYIQADDIVKDAVKQIRDADILLQDRYALDYNGKISGSVEGNPIVKTMLPNGTELINADTGFTLNIADDLGTNTDKVTLHELLHYMTGNSSGEYTDIGKVSNGDWLSHPEIYYDATNKIFKRGTSRWQDYIMDQNNNLLPLYNNAVKIVMENPDYAVSLLKNAGRSEEDAIKAVQSLKEEYQYLYDILELRAHLQLLFLSKIQPNIKNPNNAEEIELFLLDNPEILQNNKAYQTIQEIRPGTLKDYAKYFSAALSSTPIINTVINNEDK